MKTQSTQNKKKVNQKLYSWMEARIPLGLSPSAELSAFAAASIVNLLYSMVSFFWYFDYCLGGLYADAKRTILLSPSDPYVSMLPFWAIARDSYRGFFVIVFMLIWAAWYHYHYHSQKSKSIYLMKRLPAKNELKKRCLTLPVTGLLITAAMAISLTAIYYICYITITPEAFL